MKSLCFTNVFNNLNSYFLNLFLCFFFFVHFKQVILARNRKNRFPVEALELVFQWFGYAMTIGIAKMDMTRIMNYAPQVSLYFFNSIFFSFIPNKIA